MRTLPAPHAHRLVINDGSAITVTVTGRSNRTIWRA